MRAARDHTPSLTGDSSVAAVIAEFMRTTDRRGDQRGLRAALSHVEAEFGTMPVRAVRPRHVTALLDDLWRAGLSSRREAAIEDALSSLFAFAVARGLVADAPVQQRRAPRAAEAPRRPPPVRAVPTAAPTVARTPTMTMVALGARVAFWTTWIIMLAFIVALVALVVEFG